MRDQELIAAAREVDVLETARSILGNPHRAMVSLAAKVAMAASIERLTALAAAAADLAEALIERADIKRHGLLNLDGPQFDRLQRLDAAIAALARDVEGAAAALLVVRKTDTETPNEEQDDGNGSTE